MGRSKNILKTVQLTISTTGPVVENLEALVLTGLYGKNYTEAAERLITKGIQDLQKEGHLIKPKSRLPKSLK